MELELDIDENSLLDAFRKNPTIMERELSTGLIDIGNHVKKNMRLNRRYINRSGSLERATGYRFNRSDLTLTMGIPFDPTNATITNSGVSYGVYVHEGHGSWKGDKFVTNNIENSRGFMERAFEIAINRAIGKF